MERVIGIDFYFCHCASFYNFYLKISFFESVAMVIYFLFVHTHTNTLINALPVTSSKYFGEQNFKQNIHLQ